MANPITVAAVAVFFVVVGICVEYGLDMYEKLRLVDSVEEDLADEV